MKCKVIYYLYYIIVCCTVSCCLPVGGYAQKQCCIWYFGQYAGLDFNSGKPVALTDGALEIAGGSSSIADENGRLLFYTDGWNVWNRNHERMPGNGYRLNGGGDGSAHSGFIVPKPGSRTEYYIFTSDMPPPFGQYGLQYSIIDMKAEGGLGDVVVKNVPILDSICTKIAITRHANGHDFWVVTQHMDTNAFYSFLVTGEGVSEEPVISYVGISPKTDYASSRGGQIKFSLDGRKIATAMFAPLNRFEIMEFDRSTGRLSNAIVSPILGSYRGVFGIEFSPDNKKLYVSIPYTNQTLHSGQLLQFDISDYDSIAVISSKYRVHQNECYQGIQIAPNGKIYICHGENENYISSIDNPNAKGKDCQYSHQSVYLGGKTSNSCFPSFLTSYFRKPDIMHHRTCPGDTTFFSLSETAEIDSVRWDFGDPVSGVENTANVQDARHVFSSPGTYTVRLRAYSGWVSDVVEHTVVVAPLPVVDLGPDREACVGTDVWLSAGEGGLSYEWSTGEIANVIKVRESGTYWVVKRHGICEERDTVKLTFVMPKLALDQDTLICEGNSVHLHAPEGATYLWEPSEGLSAVDVADPVAAPTTTTTYTVTVKSEDGCHRQGRVTVNVLPKSLLTVKVADTLAVSGMSNFALPVVVHTPSTSLPLYLHELEADITFPSDAFEVQGITAGVSTTSRTGGETIVHIRLEDVELVQEQQELLTIRGLVLLGRNLTSLFEVKNVRINGCEQEQTGISSLTLDSAGMCMLNIRRIRPLEMPEIELKPHPVTNESSIGIRITESGLHRIVVYNATGTIVWEEVFEGSPVTVREVPLPEYVSSGLYNMTLYTPSGAIRRTFVVSR